MSKFESNKGWRYLLRLSRWIILFVIVISPWLFGSAEPWEYFGISLAVLLAGSLWMLSLILNPHRPIHPKWAPMILTLFVLFYMFQLFPSGKYIVGKINPVSLQGYEAKEAIFGQFKLDRYLDKESAIENPSISLAPRSTLISFYLFVTYAVVFLVMANALRSWDQVKRATSIIFIMGFILAVVSIIHKLTGSDKLLWFRVQDSGGQSFGPFTNRNHYALYMNLIFSAGLALFLLEVKGASRRWYTDWREKVALLSTSFAAQFALLVFMLAIVGGSICFSLSRGGVASILAAIGITGLLLAVRSKSKSRIGWQIIAAIIILGGGAMFLGWEPIVSRMSSITNEIQDPLRNGRVLTTIDAARMFSYFPIAGSGMGTFERVFPAYQTETSLYGRFRHAHNDWIQLMAEGGIIGTFLFMLFILFFIRSVSGGYYGTSTTNRRFGIALLTGIIAVAFHSTVEYGLHKPANAILLSGICGLMLSAFRMTYPVEAYEYTGDQLKCRRAPSRCLFVSIMLCLLIILFVSGINIMRGELAAVRLIYYDKVMTKYENHTQRLEESSKYCIHESGLIRRFGAPSTKASLDPTLALMKWALDSSISPKTRMKLTEETVKMAVYSVEVAPSDYLSWYYLAHALLIAGEWDGADAVLTRAKDLSPYGQKLRLKQK